MRISIARLSPAALLAVRQFTGDDLVGEGAHVPRPLALQHLEGRNDRVAKGLSQPDSQSGGVRQQRKRRLHRSADSE